MALADPLKSIRHSAYRHGYDDGLAEILIGILLATAALTAFRPGGVVVTLAVALLANRVLPRLRDRITTPRVGSAVLPEKPADHLPGMAGYGLLCAATVFAAYLATRGAGNPLGGYRWIPLFLGLFLSGGFLFVIGRARLIRFYIYLAVSVGGGFWQTLAIESGSRQAAYQATADLMWLLAAIFVIVGTAVLIRFVRRNPVFIPEEAPHGN